VNNESVDFFEVENNLKLNDLQKDILNLVRENINITQEQLADALYVTRRTIVRNFKYLSDNHLIERMGSKKTGYWKLYI